jgi:hypothetical protein
MPQQRYVQRFVFFAESAPWCRDLMIIDILTTGVALRLGSAQLRPMLQEIKKNLRQRRYVVGDADADAAGGNPVP